MYTATADALARLTLLATGDAALMETDGMAGRSKADRLEARLQRLSLIDCLSTFPRAQPHSTPSWAVGKESAGVSALAARTGPVPNAPPDMRSMGRCGRRLRRASGAGVDATAGRVARTATELSGPLGAKAAAGAKTESPASTTTAAVLSMMDEKG